MPKFLAMLKGKRQGELTKDLLMRHVEHLQKLSVESKLFFCGPLKNNDHAMQILICDSIDEARQLVESDPFVREGYYLAYEVNEVMEANEENRWLMDIPQTVQNLAKGRR